MALAPGRGRLAWAPSHPAHGHGCARQALDSSGASESQRPAPQLLPETRDCGGSKEHLKVMRRESQRATQTRKPAKEDDRGALSVWEGERLPNKCVLNDEEHE